MSAVKGVNVTKHDAGGQGDDAIDNGLVNTRVEVWTDTYEAVALASGSTIDMAKLPANAVVLGIDLITDALGTSTTIDVGDSQDPDRYSAAAFNTSAAGLHVSDTPDGNAYRIGTNDGDGTVQLLTAGAAITGTVKTVVRFTR